MLTQQATTTAKIAAHGCTRELVLEEMNAPMNTAHQSKQQESPKAEAGKVRARAKEKEKEKEEKIEEGVPLPIKDDQKEKVRAEVNAQSREVSHLPAKRIANLAGST